MNTHEHPREHNYKHAHTGRCPSSLSSCRFAAAACLSGVWRLLLQNLRGVLLSDLPPKHGFDHSIKTTLQQVGTTERTEKKAHFPLEDPQPAETGTKRSRSGGKTYPPQIPAALTSPFWHLQMHFHREALRRLVFVPLPFCHISQVQTVGLGGGGGVCAYSTCARSSKRCVCSCSHAHVQMCATCHFHLLVNRKVKGTCICQGSDNSRPPTASRRQAARLHWSQQPSGCFFRFFPKEMKQAPPWQTCSLPKQHAAPHFGALWTRQRLGPHTSAPTPRPDMRWFIIHVVTTYIWKNQGDASCWWLVHSDASAPPSHNKEAVPLTEGKWTEVAPK